MGPEGKRGCGQEVRAVLPAHTVVVTPGLQNQTEQGAGRAGGGPKWLMVCGKEVSSRARRLVKRALPGSNEVKAVLRGTEVPATAPRKRLGSSGKRGKG